MKTDMELRQERDAHRKAARKVSKLLRQRSRKAHGLPQRKKGMGVRIGDRDDALKAARGYTDPSTYVRRDGSEKLAGQDLAKRQDEIKERSGGQCEQLLGYFESNRCPSAARHIHHIVKRSVRRDDRATNLIHICEEHHDMKHPEFKTQWTPRKIRSGKAGA